MIDKTKNYDTIFLRQVGTSLCKTLTRNIKWINYFTDSKIRVVVKYYLSLVGGETFLLDSFVDDTSDKRIELNTDIIPRGYIDLKSFEIKSDEFANPNSYIAKECKINNELRSIISTVKAVPLTLNYEVRTILDSELDVYKLQEKILEMLFNYKFFSFDYCGMKINAVFTLPSSNEIVLPREVKLDTETRKEYSLNLQVQTYYPVFLTRFEDLEVCDNDNEISWDELDIPRPVLSTEFNIYDVTDLQHPLNPNSPNYDPTYDPKQDPHWNPSIDESLVDPNHPNFDPTNPRFPKYYAKYSPIDKLNPQRVYWTNYIEDKNKRAIVNPTTDKFKNNIEVFDGITTNMSTGTTSA